MKRFFQFNLAFLFLWFQCPSSGLVLASTWETKIESPNQPLAPVNYLGTQSMSDGTLVGVANMEGGGGLFYSAKSDIGAPIYSGTFDLPQYMKITGFVVTPNDELLLTASFYFSGDPPPYHRLHVVILKLNANGVVLWQRDVPDFQSFYYEPIQPDQIRWIFSPDGATVYCSLQNAFSPVTLVALDLMTGHVRWQRGDIGDTNYRFYAVSNGLTRLTNNGHIESITGTELGVRFSEFDPATGTRLVSDLVITPAVVNAFETWQLLSSEQFAVRYILSENRNYITRAQLWDLNAHQLKWESNVAVGNQICLPLISNEYIVATCENYPDVFYISRYGEDSAAPLWTTPVSFNAKSITILVDGSIAVSGNAANAPAILRVARLDPVTGVVISSRDFPKESADDKQTILGHASDLGFSVVGSIERVAVGVLR
jgi:outer membrane protein assembly factor BamB